MVRNVSGSSDNYSMQPDPTPPMPSIGVDGWGCPVVNGQSTPFHDAQLYFVECPDKRMHQLQMTPQGWAIDPSTSSQAFDSSLTVDVWFGGHWIHSDPSKIGITVTDQNGSIYHSDPQHFPTFTDDNGATLTISNMDSLNPNTFLHLFEVE